VRLASIFSALAITAALLPGRVAPDFTLRDENGKAVALSAARGSKVVLVFYRGYW
jgi:peroxiredoxin